MADQDAVDVADGIDELAAHNRVVAFHANAGALLHVQAVELAVELASGGQLVQMSAAPRAMEAPTLLAKAPAMQVQVVWPASEKAPNGQGTHCSAAPVALPKAKKPGAQPQVLEPGDETALAGHVMQLDAPAEEKELAAQSAHVAFEAAPVADEYMPATHGVQLDAPGADQEPAAQAVQFDAPAADVEPAQQLAQSRSEVGKHGMATYRPATHAAGGMQAVHGEKPVAENVLPATHAARSTFTVTFAEAASEPPAPVLVACTTRA